MIGGSESGKIYLLFNRISQPPDIDKIYLHSKDPFKAKYLFFNSQTRKYSIKAFKWF